MSTRNLPTKEALPRKLLRRYAPIDRRLIYFVVSLLILFMAATGVILFARGYNFNFKEKTFTKTGIISISSVPTQASVYLNDTLVTATNNTLNNILPGKYKIRVTKEGYTSWEKEVEVQKEVVTPLEIVLFPSVPDLSPLTFSGVISPKYSPDQNKIVYAIKNGEKTGLWVLDLTERPVIFSKDPKQIIKDSGGLNFSDSQFSWAPDSKSIVVKFKDRPDVFLLNGDSLNRDPLDNISSNILAMEKNWAEEDKTEEKSRIAKLPEMGQNLATTSGKILFSPDEKRFLTFKETGEKKIKASVYDSKPSPDPTVKEANFELPEAKQYFWYPDSQHIVLVEENSISIVEKDGTNKSTIYSGSFDVGFVFAANNGTRLLIAANFNSSLGNRPNLYAINLR